MLSDLPAGHIELDPVRRLSTPQTGELAQRVTRLRYLVLRP